MAETFLPPVVATLVADIKQFETKMATAKGEMDELEAKGASTGAALSKGLGMGALAVGALGLAVAGESIHLAENFQSAMTTVQNTADLSNNQVTALGDAFLGTMGKSQFSATEIANAYAGVAGQLLVLNGHALTTKQALSTMTSASQLAVASHIDLGSATNDLVGIMKAFQQPVSKAADVSNQLYVASALSGTSVDSLSGQFTKLHQRLGVAMPNLGDMNTFLMDLTQHGLGSGRSLLAMTSGITGLLAPTKQTAPVIQQLGLNTYDLNGHFVGLRSIIEQLEPHFRTMTQQQQLQTSATLFGKSAAEGMTQVILGGLPAYDKAAKALANHKTVSDAAKNSSKDFHNQLKTLSSSATDLGIKLGIGLLPIAQEVVNWMSTSGLKGIRDFIAGFDGKKVHDFAGSLGKDIRGIVNISKTIFNGIKDAYNLLPAPLRPIALGIFGGAAVGGKIGGLPGAGVGAAVGGTVGGIAGGSTSSFLGSVGTGAVAGAGVGLLGGPFAEISVPAGAGIGAVLGGASYLLNSLFGGSPAGAATTKSSGSSGDTVTAIVQQLQYSNQTLAGINQWDDYISQHTREANGHLMDIKGLLKSPPKVTVTASFK